MRFPHEASVCAFPFPTSATGGSGATCSRLAGFSRRIFLLLLVASSVPGWAGCAAVHERAAAVSGPASAGMLEEHVTGQSGVVNVADLQARLDAALARIDQLNAEVNGVKVEMGGGDQIARWIAAAGAWIVYPLVWRPLRRWRERRRANGEPT